jgi:hypothetical protein
MKHLQSSEAGRAAIALMLACPFAAHAYIDAGTGSYVLQILAATLLGGLFAVKLYWKKLVTFVRTLGRERHEAPTADER